MPASVLVGRDRPAAVLRDAVARAREGRGGLALVTGEPGVGKTRLVTEVAEEARREGALVVTGTCWDGEGAPGYWPWVQVVRALERVDPVRWAVAREAAGDAVAHLLGEVRGMAPAAPPAADAGFRLYDAVTTLLVNACNGTPVVVVIDDLQWADVESVRLLDFLVRHTTLEPVLVLATYRDAEVEAPDHPLRDLVVALSPKATTVSLAGLDADGVAALMAEVAGRRPDALVAAEVQRRTGGNPFFVEQTARLWAAGSPVAAMAPGVRDALERRIARLPAATAADLAAGALLGSEFDGDVLAAATGRPIHEIAERLRPAVSARLLRPLGEDRFGFSHDLVREVLDDAMGEAERRSRCAAIVLAVTASPALHRRMLPAQLAHLARLAVPDLDPAIARRHLLAAARDASSRLASEEACAHYRRALDLAPSGEGAGRAEVALALGAEQLRAGDLDGARRTFEDVVAVARDHDDAESLARAALGLHAIGFTIGRVETGAELLEEASGRVAHDPAGSAPLAARLLAAISRAHTHEVGADRAAAEEVSARAVALAREAGDDGALGFCLLARHDAVWKPGTAAERLGLAGEMHAVARRTADTELELQASLLRTVALLEQGDPAGLREAEAFVARAERTRLPRFRYLALSRQGTIATLQGRFDEARAFIDAARDLADQLGEPDAANLWGDQVWELARLRGDFDEVDRQVEALHAAGDPHVVVMDVARAADRGDLAEARRLLPDVEALASAWPRWAQLLWLTYLAETAAALEDPDRVEAVRAAIEPFADQWAVLAGAVLIRGPLVHWRAAVDAVAERWDDASAGFAAAVESAERLGARPWVVLARVGLADTLIRRAGPGDVARAASLLDAAEDEAAALGMRPALDRAVRLRPHTDASAAPPLSLSQSPSPVAANVFRFDGSVWTLAFAGRTVHVPDAKGLRDVHVLLGRPGADVAAAALLEAAGVPAASEAGRWGADEVLDDRAKAAYRRRLAELDAEIEDALAGADDERAAKLDAERKALIDELRRAAGLGGRPRRLHDEAERARKTVTARIRDSLRRLGGAHPELADHLRATVSTGSTCRYDPGRTIDWRL